MGWVHLRGRGVMTIQDLVDLCGESFKNNIGVKLVLPGRPPRGAMVRFDRSSKRKCPMGEILCHTKNGTTALFDPLEIIAYLCATGEVRIDVMVEDG